MKTGTIYGLVCPITNNIVYVGRTFGELHDRLIAHRTKKRWYVNKTKLAKWLVGIRKKRKIKQLTMVALESNVCETIIKERELFHIRTLMKTHELLNMIGTLEKPVKMRSDKKKGVTNLFRTK